MIIVILGTAVVASVQADRRQAPTLTLTPSKGSIPAHGDRHHGSANEARAPWSQRASRAGETFG